MGVLSMMSTPEAANADDDQDVGDVVHGDLVDDQEDSLMIWFAKAGGRIIDDHMKECTDIRRDL